VSAGFVGAWRFHIVAPVGGSEGVMGGLYSGSTSSSVLVVIAKTPQAGLWFDQGTAAPDAAAAGAAAPRGKGARGATANAGRRRTCDVRLGGKAGYQILDT
jgi:hypothetical protein